LTAWSRTPSIGQRCIFQRPPKTVAIHWAYKKAFVYW